jgi:ABC-type multidrug transport system fused ATPase/permease subunit
VLSVLKKSIGFMSAKERIKLYLFFALRALVSLFDLAGILAIGLLATSAALFLAEGSDPDREITLGPLVFPSISAQSLPIIAGLILALFVGKAVASILLTRQLAHFLAKVEARAAHTISINAFGKGLESARLNSRDEVIYAVQAGSPSAFNSILNAAGTFIAEGSLFVLVLATFFAVDVVVAFGAVIYFGIIGVLIQIFVGRVMQKTATKVTNGTVEANEGLSDLAEVIREATILGRQKFYFDKIYSSRLKTSASTATQYVLAGMPRYIIETALIIAMAIFLLVQASRSDLVSSAATLAIFLSGGLRLTASLLPLQSALLSIKQAIPPAERALEIIAMKPGKSPEFLEAEIRQEPIAVEVSNLNFSYSGSQSKVLDNISLSIKPGSQVAFIGESGAGKSTLADLVLGLLSPTSGSILIEGESPSSFLAKQPGQVGYVPQQPGLVNGTIAQNIALGHSGDDIDTDRLTSAIKDSHLEKLITSLPQGVNTDIGKRKDELSGGQIQRIGLARALYTQPKLLVMDEATSALDAESENEINKALDEMRGRVTVILIAHRLNTIQRSDTVYLMDQGRIVDQGTFSHLHERNEKVRKLAKLMKIENLD